MKDSIRNDHHKIEPTAVVCARIRNRYTDLKYAKDVYSHVASEEDLDMFGKFGKFLITHPRISGLLFPEAFARMSSLEGRYVSTNDALRIMGDCSVLEIAAGLSTRGLEFAAGDKIYIESDQPRMIDIKRRITQEVRDEKGIPAPQNHYFMPMNVLEFEEMQTAGKLLKSVGNTKPVAIVHEGLLGYFNKTEQRVLRDNISGFLRMYSPDGAWISTDFSSRTHEKSRVIMWALGKIKKATERDMTFFKSDEDALDFLDEGGLVGEFIPNEHLVIGLTCLKRPGFKYMGALETAIRYRACMVRLAR